MSGQSGSVFDPLWRRLAIIAACAGWAALEWLNGQTGWALLAAAATAYGVWSLLIAWAPPQGPAGPDGRDGESD
ncbi:hypothetical protein [Nitratireductor sp. StC3]|uniref:hypothetical protein n=1 Tax=Nitratireductor sp. StC3 TaxID=2126741 RepID=UPI000D0CF2F7|nr:hypothetical protein [Nitratireductor sp. StC3]PSM19326.1 hypothetical protein C7T96_06425 [Nitratireductor sp. StC3]